MAVDAKRELLRHTVATLAYRGGKAIANSPDGFSEFRNSESTRTPGAILAHSCDLLDWALCVAKGDYTYKQTDPSDWQSDSQRFFGALEELDNYLASDAPLGYPAEKIFQGPIADALTHVGQIAMLRRMAGAPIRGESYFKAEIATGRVGRDQPAPRFEFD